MPPVSLVGPGSSLPIGSSRYAGICPKIIKTDLAGLALDKTDDGTFDAIFALMTIMMHSRCRMRQMSMSTIRSSKTEEEKRTVIII